MWRPMVSSHSDPLQSNSQLAVKPSTEKRRSGESGGGGGGGIPSSSSSSPFPPALTSTFSPTLLTLLDQLTPFLPITASHDERLQLLTTALQEVIATTILFPSSLPSPPPPPPPLLPPPMPSTTSSSAAFPLLGGGGGVSMSPIRLPPPSLPSVSSEETARTRRSASTSSFPPSSTSSPPQLSPPLPPLSSSPPSSSSSFSSSTFADLRVLCDLLLLSYIDALARPIPSSPSPSLPSLSSSASPPPLPLSLPPSPSTLLFLSFLRSHPHFATTSAFSSLLSYVVAHTGGLLFLLSAAAAHQRMTVALSFIAAHALTRISLPVISFLVGSSYHGLLLSTTAGGAIFRCLGPSPRLEMLLLLLLSPLPSVSSLSVLCALSAVLGELDVHGLYRVCTMLDPQVGTVPAKGLDNYTRILLVELWLEAIIRLRAKAEEREREKERQRQPGPAEERKVRENKQTEAEVEQEKEDKEEEEEEEEEGEEEDSSECSDDGEDEELSFYTAERLHLALMAHRGSYRAWRVLSFLFDHGQVLAVAGWYEANHLWTDAFEVRIQHLRSSLHPPPSPAFASVSLLHLLDNHVVHAAPSDVEQARMLGALAWTWRDLGLPLEELERHWLERFEELAEALCILCFASPSSLQNAIPPAAAVSVHSPSLSSVPLSFSPLLRLHLTSHRLELLHSTQSSSLSSTQQTITPRLWHEILSRLHSTVSRRSHVTLHPPVPLNLSHSYQHDEVMAFTCGHCHYVHDLYEVHLPTLISRLKGLDVDLKGFECWCEVEFNKELTRTACPSCVWTAIQAEASRLASSVQRVVNQEGGAAQGGGGGAAGPGISGAKEVDKGGKKVAGRNSGGGGNSIGGGGAAASNAEIQSGGHADTAVYRSPVGSPTISRSSTTPTSASSHHPRANKLETWR